MIFAKHSGARTSAAAQTKANGHIYRASGKCPHCQGFHVNVTGRKSSERHGPPQIRDKEARVPSRPRIASHHRQVRLAFMA